MSINYVFSTSSRKLFKDDTLNMMASASNTFQKNYKYQVLKYKTGGRPLTEKQSKISGIRIKTILSGNLYSSINI